MVGDCVGKSEVGSLGGVDEEVEREVTGRTEEEGVWT